MVDSADQNAILPSLATSSSFHHQSTIDYQPLPMTDLELATHAALEAGELLRKHFGSDAVVDEASHHDIKLALDKESQDLITKILLGAREGDALYGEEGIAGDQDSVRQCERGQ